MKRNLFTLSAFMLMPAITIAQDGDNNKDNSGSGNNGGDGLAVVRILTTMGVSSAWYMAGDTAKATKETALQIKILENL